MHSNYTIQNPSFYLGFIAGEGCFAVAIRSVDSSSVGIRFYPYFLLTVDKQDKKFLEDMRSQTEGSVRTSNNLAYYRINGFKGSNNLREFIEENRSGEFERTAKYKSYRRWCEWIDNYETPKTREDVIQLIESSQEINKSKSGGGKSVEEWLNESKV